MISLIQLCHKLTGPLLKKMGKGTHPTYPLWNKVALVWKILHQKQVSFFIFSNLMFTSRYYLSYYEARRARQS